MTFFVEETQSVNNDFRCCVEAKVAGPTRGTHTCLDTCLVLSAPPHVLFTVRLVLASSQAWHRHMCFLPSASSLRPRRPRFVATTRFVATRLGRCLRTCLSIRVWRSKINAKTNVLTYSFKTLQEFRLHRCLHWRSLSWISRTRASSILA